MVLVKWAAIRVYIQSERIWYTYIFFIKSAYIPPNFLNILLYAGLRYRVNIYHCKMHDSKHSFPLNIHCTCVSCSWTGYGNGSSMNSCCLYLNQLWGRYLTQIATMRISKLRQTVDGVQEKQERCSFNAIAVTVHLFCWYKHSEIVVVSSVLIVALWLCQLSMLC